MIGLFLNIQTLEDNIVLQLDKKSLVYRYIYRPFKKKILIIVADHLEDKIEEIFNEEQQENDQTKK